MLGSRFCCFNDWKAKREVVKNGIEALKAVWHRGAVDADGKTGDGAGIHIEFSRDFFIEQIKVTGHEVRMIKRYVLEWFFTSYKLFSTRTMQNFNKNY